MSKPEDILEQGFELAPEATTPPAPSVTEKLVARLEDRFSESMSLLKRIPVTLTLEVSSVEVMLADLLNIDDDTVIGAVDRDGQGRRAGITITIGQGVAEDLAQTFARYQALHLG